MAPKGSQASAASSQEKKLVTLFKKLSSEILKEKKKGTTVKAANAAKSLNEALRNCRKNKIQPPATCIEELVAIIDDDSDVCRKLDETLFAVIVHSLLQADYCLSGERLFYLLAASLSRDVNEANDEATLAGVTIRKYAIGKECLLQLVEFFLDQDNDGNIRRWAGVLCIQLIRDCEGNIHRLELSGEAMRRNIGALILKETNEIVRFVCGELVKTLVDGEIVLEELWPFGTDADVYTPFPMSSQGTRGWTSNFEKYVDDLYDQIKDMPKSDEQLLPLSSLGFSPRHVFGTPHQNIVASMGPERLSLLAPTLPIKADQILDIPTMLIKQVTITTQNISQSTFAKVTFAIDRSVNAECQLDGIAMDLEEMCGSLALDSLNILRSALKDYCPNAVILEVDESDVPTDGGEPEVVSQQSHGMSQDLMYNSPTSNPEKEGERNLQEDRALPDLEDGAKRTATGSLHHPADVSKKESSAISGDDGNGQLDDDTIVEGNTETLLKIKARRTINNKVKPKAKTPILLGGRGNNGKASESQATTTSQNESQVKKITQSSSNKVQSGKTSSYQATTQTTHNVKLGTINGTPQQKNGQGSATHAAAGSQKDKNSKGKDRTTMEHSLASSSKPRSQTFVSDSDEVTTPEPDDASTPKKLMPPPPKPKNKCMVPAKATPTPQTQEKKKYSLHGTKTAAPPTSRSDATMFNTPDDAEDEDSDVEVEAKKRTKKGASKAVATKGSKKATKSKVKPGRKSAPAVLQQSNTPARHSQRAAASKASQSIRDMTDEEDGIEEDEEIEEASEVTSKPATLQKLVPKAPSQTTSDAKKKVPTAPEVASSKPQAKRTAIFKTVSMAESPCPPAAQLSSEEQADIEPPDQESNTNIHLDEVETAMEEDLYNATPQKPKSQVRSDPIAPSEQQETKKVAPRKRSLKTSAADMASKLQDALVDLDDTEVSTAVNTTKANTDTNVSTRERFAAASGGRDQINEEMLMKHEENKVTKNVPIAAKQRDEELLMFHSPSVGLPEFSSPNASAPLSPVAAEDSRTHEGDMKLSQIEKSWERSPNLELLEISMNDSENATLQQAPESEDVQVDSNEDKQMKTSAVLKPASIKQHNAIVSNNSGSSIHEDAPGLDDIEMGDIEEEELQLPKPKPATYVKPSNKKQAEQESGVSLLSGHSSKIRKPNIDEEQEATDPRSSQVVKRGSESHEVDKGEDQKPNGSARTDVGADGASKRKSQCSDEQEQAADADASNNIEHGSNKRKPKLEELRPVKRRKPEETEATKVDDMQDTKGLAQNATKQQSSKKSRQPEQASPTPVRRSPRLNRAKKAAKSLQEVVDGSQFVDEKVHRKTPIIAFGASGPRNQGRSIIKKVATEERSTASKHDPEVLALSTGSGHKRKRSHGNAAEDESPPAKRRESSPIQDAENDISENDSAPIIFDTTPVRNPNVEMSMARPRPTSRPSSQGSRVDANGSPIGPASIHVDHIGQLKQRLHEEKEVDEEIPENPKKTNKGDVKTRPRTLSQAFGPMIKVSAKPKPQLSYPEEVSIRYVAHEKTEGQYTGVASREVIPLEKVLPNPFAAEHTRKSNIFTDRLLASAVKKRQHPHDSMLKDHPRAHRNTGEQGQYELPKLPRDTAKVHFRQDRSGRQIFDPEETLVHPKHRHVNQLSDLSDMTNGSSFESSDSSREPLAERPAPNTLWNVALRPHYKSLTEAVHRVADEVIIRLSDEEDRMDLMVDQYRDNGGRIVDNLSKKRDSERTTVLQSMDGKKQQMMSVYTEAKASVQKAADDLKGYQLNRFEKAWSKQQAEVRKQISEGRKGSEQDKSSA